MADEREREILRARARRLATAPPVENRDETFLDLIEFSLADERYAVEQRYVRRVTLTRAVTPLPRVPDYVVGITFDGGRIYSVVDIKAWFGLPRRGPSERDPLLIVADRHMEFGILADVIHGVTRCAAGRIVPRDDGADARDPFLLGVTAEGLIVIDLERVLSSDGIVVR